MLAEEIAPLVRRRPFVQMRLHLADGTTFDFLQPHLSMVSRRWLHVATNVDPEAGVVYGSTDVWVQNIVRIQDINPSD